ncbi:L-threonylcarbamoyladenylate synthase [Chthonobacter albigriseus]|uniref:L-threonylcarbamoyladenylate synthase n=1 Tax=Chthonobacter albigriseus TaxID=1683161 RepID=UPI0015EE7D4A|nr:L-threonylcarbamoyladenylate synthase [Chthonobacter albigriseus]
MPPDRPTITSRLTADPASIDAAGALLRQGGLVAFPTETVYGLGADATNGRAVAGIYAAKGRPSFNPLITHVPDLAAADRFARFDQVSRRLAEAFWPGPLTLVLPRVPGAPISDLATAGLDTVALRVPRHPVALALLRAAGVPVVAPSANRSGHVSPTTADHVLADLAGRIDAVVDGGPTEIGVESTIVLVAGDRIRLLRPGGVDRAALARVSGLPVDDAADPQVAPIAPGMLASHYAPTAGVRLNATSVAPGEALLGFGPAILPGSDGAVAVQNLSPTGDLAEAAANLFGMLRSLDASGASAIAVAPVPETGLGEAIVDRLRRAAAPR